MTGEFDIRASPATHLPVRHNIGMMFKITERETGEESEVLVWMPRGSLVGWGFQWRGEDAQIDMGAVRLLMRAGLETVIDALHNEDEIPGEVAVRMETQGNERPKFERDCVYQEKNDSGLVCKASAIDDPRRGQTNPVLCMGCEMPDRVVMCSEMLDPKAAWYPDETEHGVRDIVQSLCRVGQDPGTGSGCLPGLRDCWIKSVEVL